ncbi:rhamnogalacturonan acetylesterase [Saccharibacillus sp. CPCC 101409]|uniref:rhamnogalacturonan acetylesterase n=1 Tax=Saccharibacillus sp. CPCC 101409 TaxID=3058041 RepID=UPI002673A787|nr:rhamnogalacturonan acetylesterase [Saccharibacillus sp. CPCC 101409]MDO3411854.1 rhamnogalacturonan acetylesterase [Saccharibacillus sp. CPCC 101409]
MTQTFYLAGDSTMASYTPDRAPMEGWGAKLFSFLPPSVRVVNEAICGRSSKSFIDEGRLDRILEHISPGDLLLIQFGHNDNKEDPLRHTCPWSTYPQTLKRYIDGARDKGAQPVLITPLCRRYFDANGLLLPTHGDYPRAVESLAVRERVPLIDLTGRSAAAFKEMGDARSREWFTQFKPGEHPNYPDGIQDNTHLNEQGARSVAALVADGLERCGLITSNTPERESLPGSTGRNRA